MSARLWDHLLDISADGRTAVIITTHYIEEARQAHTLGLMRQGVLLAEDAPDRILERHRCGSIEQVFLKLSRAQAGATTHREADVTAPAVPAAGRQPATPVTEAVTTRRQPCETQSVTDAPFAQNKPSSTSNITCLLWKHALWMRRNPLMLAFLLLLPLVSSMLFGSTVGRDPKQLKVAVVNDESGRCMDSAHARLDSFNCCSPTHLSCRFVTMLMDLDFDPVFYGTVHDAKGAVQTGKAWSAIHFPANFTDSVIVRYNDGRLASNETLVNSEVSVWLDNSNSYLSAVMRSGMTSGTMDLLQQMLDRCDFGTALAGVFVQFEAPIYGVADVQFLDFAAPGFALTIIFSIPLASAAGVILYEKNDGILNRSLVLGMTMRDVLLSHIITQAVLMVPVITVVLVSFLDLVKIHNNGPLEWVVLLCVLQGFCGLCLGMLVSSLADSDQGATYVAFAFFFPFVVLSGIMWPVEGMHPALRSMSYALPLTLPSTSLRYMMSRGWGPNHADVIYGFLSTGVWIIILLTSVMFVRSNKR